MAGTIGRAFITVEGDTSGFGRKLDEDISKSFKIIGQSAEREFSRVDRAADQSEGRVSRAFRAMVPVARAAGVAMAAALVAGLAGSAGGFAVQLAAALAPALQSVAAIPGAIAVAVAAFGAFKLATLGLSDAFKALGAGDLDKLNEAIAKLAPNAQVAVQAVAALVPAFRLVQQGVQNIAFQGIGEQIARLATVYLPVLRSGFNDLAVVLNTAASSVAEWAAQASTVRDVATIFTTTSLAGQQLQAAIAPLAQAFLDLAVSAGPFLVQIAEAATNAAQAFSQWVSQARESGQLSLIFQTALDVLKQLAQLGGDVIGIIRGIFSAADASGGNALGALGTLVSVLNQVVNSAAGQAGLGAVFSTLATLGQALAPVLTAVAGALRPLGSLLGSLVTALSPGAVALVNGLSTGLAALAPAAKPVGDAISALVTALAPILGAVGAQVGLVLTYLGTLIQSLATTLGPFIGLWFQLVQVLTAAFLPVIQQLAATVLPIVTQAALAFIQAFAPLVPMVALMATQLATSLLPAFTQLAPVLAQQLLPALVQLATTLGASFLQVLQQIQPYIPQLAQAAGQLAIALVQVLIALMPIIVAVINLTTRFIAWATAHNTVGSTMKILILVVNLAAAAFRGVAIVINTVINGVRLLGNAFSALSGAAKNAVNNLVAVVRGIPNAVKGAIGNVGSLLQSAGADLVNGFINGIRGAIGGAVSAAIDMAQSAFSAAKAALGISSPSRLFATLGRDTALGFAGGITRNIGQAVAATQAMTDAVYDEATKALQRSIPPTTVRPTLAPIGQSGLPPADPQRVRDLLEQVGIVQAGAATQPVVQQNNQITVQAPYANPEIVAQRVVDRLALVGRR